MAPRPGILLKSPITVTSNGKCVYQGTDFFLEFLQETVHTARSIPDAEIQQHNREVGATQDGEAEAKVLKSPIYSYLI
jgi:hypothetical protein